METVMPLLEVEVEDNQEIKTVGFNNIRVVSQPVVRRIKKVSRTFDVHESFLGWEIEHTPKLSSGTIRIIKFKEEIEKETSGAFKALSAETTAELERYIDDVPVSIEVANEIIRSYNLKLSKITYDKFAVELTPFGTMKYKFGLNDYTILTVIVSLDVPEELGENGVVYDLSINGTPARSNFADIDSLVDAANAYTNS